MYKIIKKTIISKTLVEFIVEAKDIANNAYPGEFLIVKKDEVGERIPLTISDIDKTHGTVTIVVQEIGLSTKKINALNEGEYFTDVVGPLGNPSDLVTDFDDIKNENILFVAGGVGSAPVYPQVKFLVEKGIKPTCIIGSRTKELLVYVDKFKELGVEVIVTTDDGSEGMKGPVTVDMKKLIEEDKRKFDRVVAIGPAIMMKFVCLLTKEHNIKTIVSMNTLMVDGTGMCGACRVKVGNETKFACVDGPEFDGHLIDFDEVMKRQSMYKDEEKRALLESEEKENGCGCSKKN